MTEHFLKRIIIDQVRHLKNLEIPLSQDTRKHLIITGKNGTGKTSLLDAIKINLNLLEHFPANYISQTKNQVLSLQIENENIEKRMEQIFNTNKAEIHNEFINLQNRLEHNKKTIEDYNKQLRKNGAGVVLEYNTTDNLDKKYRDGKFILTYFNASRVSQMIIPNGIEKIKLEDKYQIGSSVGQLFVKYLVDLKAKELFAKNAGDYDISYSIDNWFKYLEENLREIFENPKLELKFDYNNYNFLLNEAEKEPYTLNELSSGFSSILNIVTEIIMRMEKNKNNFYDMQGIVIIDEIEAHLHVSLQKKILKFLTAFFPNLQFIVTTHSPFIINSIENAIVFDLEKKILLEDLSAYSYKAILEGYFQIDAYSDVVKEQVEEFKHLSTQKYLNQNQIEKFNMLKKKFDEVPDILSEELKLELAYANLKRILGEH